MDNSRSFTIFAGAEQLASGDLATVLRAAKYHQEQSSELALIFDDVSGSQVDFDLSGSIDDVLSRELPDTGQRRPGRPRLGVVSREVTLLPRHWQWLSDQPSGASAALRRLVDEARNSETSAQRRRRLAATTGRVMTVLAGDRLHFEEAYRALDAGDESRFKELIAEWPADIGHYLLHLADWESAGGKSAGSKRSKVGKSAGSKSAGSKKSKIGKKSKKRKKSQKRNKSKVA